MRAILLTAVWEDALPASKVVQAHVGVEYAGKHFVEHVVMASAGVVNDDKRLGARHFSQLLERARAAATVGIVVVRRLVVVEASTLLTAGTLRQRPVRDVPPVGALDRHQSAARQRPVRGRSILVDNGAGREQTAGKRAEQVDRHRVSDHHDRAIVEQLECTSRVPLSHAAVARHVAQAPQARLLGGVPQRRPAARIAPSA
eukprot:4077752-Prymnesium_polylepis.1